MGESNEELRPGYKWIYSRYITVRGVRRYKKDGGVYKFQVPDKPPKRKKLENEDD